MIKFIFNWFSRYFKKDKYSLIKDKDNTNYETTIKNINILHEIQSEINDFNSRNNIICDNCKNVISDINDDKLIFCKFCSQPYNTKKIRKKYKQKNI